MTLKTTHAQKAKHNKKTIQTNPMIKFIDVDVKVLTNNADLARYIAGGVIREGDRGGTFVGGPSRDRAPNHFKRFGIVLDGGGMIFPRVSFQDMHNWVTEALEKINQREIAQAERIENERAATRDGYNQRVAVRFHDAFLALELNPVQQKFEMLVDRPGQQPQRLTAYRTLLIRHFQVALILREEQYDPRLSRWNAIEMPDGVIEAFLRQEREGMYANRAAFAHRIGELVKTTGRLESERAPSQRCVESQIRFAMFGGVECPALFPPGFTACAVTSAKTACGLFYGSEHYELTEDRLAELEHIVGEEAKRHDHLRNSLLTVFSESNGCFDVLPDQGFVPSGSDETGYVLCGHEVDTAELSFLRSHLSSIPVKPGIYTRLGTGDRIKLPELGGADKGIVRLESDEGQLVWQGPAICLRQVREHVGQNFCPVRRVYLDGTCVGELAGTASARYNQLGDYITAFASWDSIEARVLHALFPTMHPARVSEVLRLLKGTGIVDRNVKHLVDEVRAALAILPDGLKATRLDRRGAEGITLGDVLHGASSVTAGASYEINGGVFFVVSQHQSASGGAINGLGKAFEIAKPATPAPRVEIPVLGEMAV